MHTAADNNFKTCGIRQLNSEAQSDRETDNTCSNETSDTQDVKAGHEKSPSSFKNSVSIIMTDNESDIENNIFEKLFKSNDVSSIDNSWRTGTIFSKEERLQTNCFTRQ